MAEVTRRLVCIIMLILGLAQVICSQDLFNFFTKQHDIFNLYKKKDHVYNVGDQFNWGPHVDYKAWAAGKTFSSGDILEFKYVEGLNVKQVTAQNFEACRGDNAIFADQSGRTPIPLTLPGDYYFICSAFDYCKLGMKLKIHVN